MGCVMLQSGQLHAWLDSLDARPTLLPAPPPLLHLLAVSLAALSRCAWWPSWHRKIVVESDDSAAFWLHAKASTAQLMTQALQLSVCVCVCALVRVCVCVHWAVSHSCVYVTLRLGQHWQKFSACCMQLAAFPSSYEKWPAGPAPPPCPSTPASKPSAPC